jgi:hypothetical protein
MANVRAAPEFLTPNVGQLIDGFAGRSGEGDLYHPDRRYHLHRRNRVYVWKKHMEQELKDTILRGLIIPAITCHVSTAAGSLQKREIMDGGNRITALRNILNDPLLTPVEREKIRTFTIGIHVLYDLTPVEMRIQFRRLNKSVKVSDGQLYAMSEDDSPLVREALAFLNDDDYPLRARITKHFCDTKNVDNSKRDMLANAVALISGVCHGVDFLTKSFDVQDAHVASTTPIDRNNVVAVLGIMFDIFDMADATEPLTNNKKRRAQFTIGKLGPIIYDYHTDVDDLDTKWYRYIVAVRQHPDAAEASAISGAQNMTANRHLRVSTKVHIYLEEGRIASKEELSSITHETEAAGGAAEETEEAEGETEEEEDGESEELE